MATTSKISELGSANAVIANTLLVIVDGGVTKQIAANALFSNTSFQLPIANAVITELNANNIISGTISVSGNLTTGGSITTNTYADFTPAAAPAHSEGRLYYDSDKKALSYYNDINEVSNQIGRELWSHVFNNTGNTIPNGAAVYVSGNNPGAALPEVGLARADNILTAAVLGIATHDIEAGSSGYVTVFGEVGGLATNAYSNGARLYLSPTVAGGLTTTRPSRPYFLVPIGVVTKAAGGTSGEIEVMVALDIGDLRPEGNIVGGATQINYFNANAAVASSANLTYDGTTLRVVGGPIRHQTYTVAALPAAATVGAGARAAVTDASATTFNSTVAGGGANFVPVISNGTSWLIG